MTPRPLYGTEPARGWLPWGALLPILALLFVALPSLAVSLLLEQLHLVDDNGRPQGVAGLMALLLLAFPLMALVVWGWVSRVERRPLTTLGLVGGRGLRRFLHGHAIGLASVLLVVAAIWLAGGYRAGGFVPAFGSAAALGAAALLLAGFALQSSVEEITFCGWLLSGIARKFNVPLAVVLASAVFALLHCAPGQHVFATTGTDRRAASSRLPRPRLRASASSQPQSERTAQRGGDAPRGILRHPSPPRRAIRLTPDDAFVHLPALRGRLMPAEASTLRATHEVVQAWDERARRHGMPANWRLADHELEGARQALLGGHCAARSDLWIYGYGSLMWDPGFHFHEVRLADLPGYRRRFSYRTYVARGTRERPALMLSLERGMAGCCCRGLAFRIAGAMVDVESGMLWRREMLRGGYRPALLPMSTPQGEVTALVMTANTAHADYIGELPLDDTAATIASATGVVGTNREYLEQLAHQLDHLGIEDAYIAQLLQRVRQAAGD